MILTPIGKYLKGKNMKSQYGNQQGRRLIDFLLVLLCLLSISGCFTEYRNPTPMPTQKWLADFFSNPTCELPCWENIIPGKTSMVEAQRIVQARDDIVKFRGPIIPTQVGYPGIDFTWTFTNDQRGGLISSDASGKIVAAISLTLGLPLGQIIDKFGFPDQVLPKSTEVNNRAGLDLFYSQLNIRLGTLMGEKDGVIQITAQTYIQVIKMATDDWLMQSYKAYGNYKDDLIIWHGYGEYIVP
jgi:hypothetical protein